MKKVLFIGVTKYDLQKDLHLEKKFSGLSQGIECYVLAKGKLTLGKKIFGAEFYLLPKNILFWPLAMKLAFWLILSKKIDTIVAQSPLMEGLAGVILKKILGKELIVEIHGDWHVRKKLAKIAPLSLRNADKIRAVAQYLVLEAKKIAPQKPYFIFPTFTDLDDFLKEKDVRFGNFVLFVGRDNPVKGVKYLIEAWATIEKDFPQFKLVLVGEGMPEGKLPLAKVREKIRDCYCLVVPSLSEGLPRVILEAQALGKPVIATNVGGIPELVRDNETGLLAAPADSVDLAKKLRIVLGDKDMAVRLGRAARQIVEVKFSNERYLENYLKMINNT